MSNRRNKTRRRRAPRIPAGFDPLLYGPGSDPFVGLSDFDDLEAGEPLHIVGNPFGGGSPTMREATLEDCVDECEICQTMRKQILSGNPPKIMAYE